MPHELQANVRDFRAKSARCSGDESIPPTAPNIIRNFKKQINNKTKVTQVEHAPSALVVMNARMAVSAARTPQAACHSSGWCCDILRQIFLPTSKRPF
jgi:hypothetical protein